MHLLRQGSATTFCRDTKKQLEILTIQTFHEHGSFHVNWSRKFQKCNPPSQIFMKFGILVELLSLIPNIPIFQNRPSRTEVMSV